jgi:acyl-CoA thioesterase FadM
LTEFSESAVCTGEYVHVLVDPESGNRPKPIPDTWKPELLRLT